MKQFISAVCLSVWFVFSPMVALNSCQQFPSVGAPNQSVVVNAEKTLSVSKDTFEIFLKLEKTNNAFTKAKLPQVHQFAEYLRKNYVNWLITANNLKNDYKHGNGSLNALLAALKVLQDNSSQAQTYINTINQH